MTSLARVATTGGATWAVRREGGLHALPDGVTLGGLLAAEGGGLRAAIDGTLGAAVQGRLLAPVDPDTEVWAAGVTYEVSRDAREAESQEADVYRKVYDAERPEVFFKANGWRVVGPEEHIGIREDSSWDVPEPELALVVDATGAVAGYTICNDVSSRSIEGANPLYLPQAKIYQASCALGPWIVPAWEVADPYGLTIHVQILRDQQQVFADSASTSTLHRRFEELVAYLFRGEVFPRGVILSTGTSLVPGGGFTLQPGDEVVIDITGLGTLRNVVARGRTEPAAGT